MAFILGLTGGIASGKSSVSRYFLKKGYPVVDADIGARKVVEPGTKGLQRIEKTFGKEMIQSDGTLDRRKLGSVIFSDSQKRRLLDSLLGELIAEWIDSETECLKKENPPLIVWDIPLLFEVQYEEKCDAVMVVAVPETVQLERLMKRDNLSREEAENRIRSQMPLEEKAERADIVIDNSRTLEHTYRQVDTWLKEEAPHIEKKRL